MEDKAMQRALEKYPKMSRISEPHGVIPADNKSHYLGDANAEKREGFVEGYHQAEKDLELTWEDVRDICSIQYIVLNEYNDYNGPSSNILYQEVLKRFKAQKKE